MKGIVFGSGQIGSSVALNLVDGMDVTVADRDPTNLRKIQDNIGSRVSVIQVDALRDDIKHIISDYDIVVSALPGSVGFQFAKSIAPFGVRMIDISYYEDDVFLLDDVAKKSSSVIVPDIGFAPGISNVLVGHFSYELEDVKDVHIYVGGIPEKRIGGLDYVITWSVEGLLDEYTRPVHIVQNGSITQVEPLSGLEKINIQKYTDLEAFYTDGLRTLGKTIRASGSMWEKTVRYSGHAEKIRLLKDLGFFSRKKVKVGNSEIAPFDFTAEIFRNNLSMSGVKDVSLMYVKVTGTRNGDIVKHEASMVAPYDEKRKRSSMANVTSVPASATADFLSKNEIGKYGVVAPEILGKDENFYKQFINYLGQYGIIISED
ncbi:hypothetical protein [Thermoplasma volcanium GSS1]|uniref:Saccharopine dehydrogenase n=1 Tax=Thermoplasma volcanium (strain ATCC 51530 / DSM 4299 / JCM 9571 / NBRC 15438 / GSS1) TaxID=273116 RepID=Q978X1_THEVO|nr:saccharopine dehydrogenase family protein [Thermoplasma volcanium]BAB60436.1 hypothetical protein [Thermoplasma volcanium GSS1]